MFFFAKKRKAAQKIYGTRQKRDFSLHLHQILKRGTMKLKNLTLLIIVLLVADQALKIWVKTHMQLDEAIIVFPDWFQLRFIENKGAAYGMHIASSGAFDWGKLLLGIFRIALSCLVGWLIWRLSKRENTPKGVLVGLALILAGAVGNIIDSAF